MTGATLKRRPVGGSQMDIPQTAGRSAKWQQTGRDGMGYGSSSCGNPPTWNVARKRETGIGSWTVMQVPSRTTVIRRLYAGKNISSPTFRWLPI
jgi:hypothetical protein